MKRALFVLLFISALFNWSKAQYFDPNYQDKYKPSGKDSLDAIKKQQEAANPKKEEPKKDYRHKQESPDFFNKLVPGCNFSLSFGSPTMINVSPMLGYKVTSRLIPGVGATYIYYNYGGIAANFYGGRIFTRYIIKTHYFLHAEVESMMANYNYAGDPIGSSPWITSPFIGGGYIRPFGTKGGIMLTLLYNVNYNANNSFYGSPLIYRVGFFF